MERYATPALSRTRSGIKRGFAWLFFVVNPALFRAYEYAQSNGLDLEQVDNFAFDLANYRFLQVTGNNTGEIAGRSDIYDAEDNPWVGKYKPQEAEQVKRILTDPSIESTDIDKGFLAYLLNPQISGLTHAVSFDALEKVIPALTSQNSQPADNATDQPWQHLNKTERKQIMAAYQLFDRRQS